MCRKSSLPVESANVLQLTRNQVSESQLISVWCYTLRQSPCESSSVKHVKRISVCNPPRSRLHSWASQRSSIRKWWRSADCAKLRAAIISWSQRPIEVTLFTSYLIVRDNAFCKTEVHSLYTLGGKDSTNAFVHRSTENISVFQQNLRGEIIIRKTRQKNQCWRLTLDSERSPQTLDIP